jgi:hypothetical protein
LAQYVKERLRKTTKPIPNNSGRPPLSACALSHRQTNGAIDTPGVLRLQTIFAFYFSFAIPGPESSRYDSLGWSEAPPQVQTRATVKPCNLFSQPFLFLPRLPENLSGKIRAFPP